MSCCRSCASSATGWERGEISVAQEHFASNLLRGRLLGLARGWDRGAGPRAVLACPPGERHDLGLVIFGLALRELGWRITFLGADTPPDTVVETVRRLEPEALVLAVTDSARLDGVAETAAASPTRGPRSGSAAPAQPSRRRSRPRRVAARGGGAGRGGLADLELEQVVDRLAAADQARVPAADEHRGRPRDAVVVRRHRRACRRLSRARRAGRRACGSGSSARSIRTSPDSQCLPGDREDSSSGSSSARFASNAV